MTDRHDPTVLRASRVVLALSVFVLLLAVGLAVSSHPLPDALALLAWLGAFISATIILAVRRARRDADTDDVEPLGTPDGFD